MTANFHLTWRQRAEERKFTECDIEGCGRFVHYLHRWCSHHSTHAWRYGSPTQRVVFRKDVKAHESVARQLLNANKKHPAVIATRKALDDLLERATRLDVGLPKPKKNDIEGKLRYELARLSAAGVTGHEILALAAGLHFFQLDNTHILGGAGSRGRRFLLARHVLQHRLRNRSEEGYLSSHVMDRLGGLIIEATDRLLTAMQPAYTRQVEANAQRREYLATGQHLNQAQATAKRPAHARSLRAKRQPKHTEQQRAKWRAKYHARKAKRIAASKRASASSHPLNHSLERQAHTEQPQA